MYVYFFGYQNDGVLYSMKVDHAVITTHKGRSFLICCVKPEDITVPYGNLKPLIRHVDPRFDGFKMFYVPEREGEIYHRTFWLEKLDIPRADRIINSYQRELKVKKAKPTHAQQIKYLKDKISELEAENKHLQQIIDEYRRKEVAR